MQKTKKSDLVRVTLYVRVSGEEQKIKGLSLEAQQERLEAYAKEQGWLITGTYIDAAKTARKDMYKRSEFLKMMESVKRNEVDLLLFCRLDRWFRSVADYYKVMEVLEAHNCGWKTVDEEYDTTTANGRLYINVKLSIAQNEADICAERIDVVFDSKIQHGTVISGKCPFWLKVNNKRLELIPENVAILQDAFDYYESTLSQRGTITYIREKYGINWCDATFRSMLRDKLAIGIYDKNGRYNPEFCPPAISPEQFWRVQDLLKRNVYTSPSGRVYIFTSLIVCDSCNHKMVGIGGYRGKENYIYYRCNQYYQRGRCEHIGGAREDVIEQWLFDHLEDEINKAKFDWKVRAAAKKKSSSGADKAALRKKLTKLKELYVNDLINLEDYKKDYELYTNALQNITEPEEEKEPDFSGIEQLLKTDFEDVYKALSREDKRTLWRSVIKEIRIDRNNKIVGISFC